MDYTAIFEYKSFLLDEYYNQVEMNAYISECVLLEKGQLNYKTASIINEGFVDKVKDIIKKIGNIIMNLFNKFISNMDALFKKDSEYLKKYKNIILGRKYKNGEVSMYKYDQGLKNCVSAQVPAIRVNETSIAIINDAVTKDGDGKVTVDADKAKVALQESMFSKYQIKSNKDQETFDDRCKDYFRGSSSEVDYTETQISAMLKDMYDFCKDFTKIESSVKKDRGELSSITSTLIKDLDGYEKKVSTESTDIFNNPSFYSRIYESYITETNPGTQPNQPDPTKPGEQPNQPDPTKPGEQPNQPDPTKPGTQPNDKNKETKPGEVSFRDNNKNINGEHDDKNITVNTENAKQAEGFVNAYFNVAGQFLACKITVLAEIRKVFMKIIVAHVNSYTGDKEAKEDTTNKQSAGNGTDYSKANKNNNDNPFDEPAPSK